MKVLYLRATVAAVILASCSAIAQMHKVAKPQQVVRAVGVYEWTGDFAKPTASRLIPVSLYIEGKFEDAGIYVARPVPFALLSGNLYILQDAGVDKGTLDLVYAKHLQAVEPTGDLAFDDGWFGYGTVKPLAAPRKPAALKPSKTLPVITASNDTNRPHFGSKPSGDSTNVSDSSPGKPATSDDKSATTTTSSSTSTSTSDDPDRPTMKRRSSDTASSGSASGTTDSSSTAGTTGSSTSSASTPADDPDRPTMKRRSADSTAAGSDTTSTTASTSSTGNTPADDPDRPTMKRPSTDSTDTNTTSTTASNPAPADDPDRPTLKRHTAEDAKKAKISDIASVTGTDSLNDDPNRPNLHHGKPASAMTEADLPKLTGLPPNLHQMVAVSDAVNRDAHPFTLAWDDEEQHKAILEKMQAMARAQLAAYGTNPATAAPAPTPGPRRPHPRPPDRTVLPRPRLRRRSWTRS